MQPPSRFSYPGIVVALVILGLMVSTQPKRLVAQDSAPSDLAPGFGLIYGEGKNQYGGRISRVGFTSRRLSDGGRIGSLALMAEQHDNGIRYTALDESLTEDKVTLRYQAAYLEMKRYLPFAGVINYYWGVRGGYTRITGVDTSSGENREFKVDQLAPLALLAIPLMIENPGFLLLAFMDGTSTGMTVDIIPERIWLDYQIGAVLLPRYRDSVLVIEDLTLITQTLKLVMVF